MGLLPDQGSHTLENLLDLNSVLVDPEIVRLFNIFHNCLDNILMGSQHNNSFQIGRIAAENEV